MSNELSKNWGERGVFSPTIARSGGLRMGHPESSGWFGNGDNNRVSGGRSDTSHAKWDEQVFRIGETVSHEEAIAAPHR